VTSRSLGLGLPDLGVAAIVLVACIGGTVHLAPHHTWALALAVTAAVSLVVRRRWPLVTLGVATVATSIYLVLGYPYGPIQFTVLVATYSVARHRPTRTAAIAAVAAFIVLAVDVVLRIGLGASLIAIVPGSAWIVVPFALGVTMRFYGENRVRQRNRRADDERLRVAREVHDIVGHGLSAIQMQADIALHVMPKQPEHAAAALAAISRTSREALDELRVTLALARDDPEAREPLPGLARLDALAARTGDSGLPVRIHTIGSPRLLPGPVDLAAYRVVQESLTNALRHAGPAVATVHVGYHPDAVSVVVLDTGRGGEVGPGHGIEGMRRRVAALGGTFQAGPAEGGGFRVSARIPAP
jgi:signal transduction histidine kinase